MDGNGGKKGGEEMRKGDGDVKLALPILVLLCMLYYGILCLHICYISQFSICL